MQDPFVGEEISLTLRNEMVTGENARRFLRLMLSIMRTGITNGLNLTKKAFGEIFTKLISASKDASQRQSRLESGVVELLAGMSSLK